MSLPMKKAILFSLLLLVGFASCSLEKDKKMQHITYQDYIDKIWDFEKHPDSLVFKGNTAVIIDFYSKSCRPCMMLLPIMEKMAEEYEGNLTIYKVNVDEEPALTKAFRVKGLPVIYYIPASGSHIKRQDGLPSEESLRTIIEQELLDQPKQEE